jgi:predicted DNA binding CopG/RHH family protein
MKRTKQFPFDKARRISTDEVRSNRRALEAFDGKQPVPRIGRPPKANAEKYVPISVRLHPLALAWLKKQAKKESVPYQTIINQILLRHAA